MRRAARTDGTHTQVVLTLPYPPSANRYWRHLPGRSRPVLSREAKEYREQVAGCVLEARAAKHLPCRLSMDVTAHCPDYRRRDLDNLLKQLQDALQGAGVFADDGQIDDLRIRRGEPCKGGKVEVRIEAIGGER